MPSNWAMSKAQSLLPCRCGDAWVGRGRHEANARCDDVEDVAEALDAVRAEALRNAARAVCMYCGRRADPMRREVHAVHGPNEAGNFVHHVSPNRVQLCYATEIHFILHVSALAARGEASK